MKKDYLFYAFLAVIFVILYTYGTAVYKNKNTEQKMSIQAVVCDLVYGVQYFEYKGQLTLRVNQEGVPIKCYE